MIDDEHLLLFMGDINKNMQTQAEEINKLSERIDELVEHIKISNDVKKDKAIEELKNNIYSILNGYGFPINKKKYKTIKISIMEKFDRII